MSPWRKPPGVRSTGPAARRRRNLRVPAAILHAKLAIVDDAVFVGSANLDARSLGINYELMVRIVDPLWPGKAGRSLPRIGRVRCRSRSRPGGNRRPGRPAGMESWRRSC